MDDKKMSTWLLASLIGLAIFLVSAVAEALINLWLFKKYGVCPYMQDKRKEKHGTTNTSKCESVH